MFEVTAIVLYGSVQEVSESVSKASILQVSRERLFSVYKEYPKCVSHPSVWTNILVRECRIAIVELESVLVRVCACIRKCAVCLLGSEVTLTQTQCFAPISWSGVLGRSSISWVLKKSVLQCNNSTKVCRIILYNTNIIYSNHKLYYIVAIPKKAVHS